MTIARLIAGRDGPIWTCHADDIVADIVELLALKRIGAVPVQDAGEQVAGIFSERDLLYCLQTRGAEALGLTVREVMTAPAITIPPETTVDEALALMTRRRVRHLPVIRDGHMAGFVSIGDLVKYRMDRIAAEADAMRTYIQTA